MGGQHSDLQAESFRKADWTQVALKEKGEILWSHRRDANVKLVSYPIFSQSQKQFKHEKDLYYHRKNNPRLVAALALESFENEDFCSTQYKQTLFLEHIPITLSDIEHIPYPDHLHIYDQSFKGFQQLATAVGCFIVEDEHIGINEKGIVKVWLNGDFHRSFIVGCRVMEEIMVRSIVETIDKSSDEITLPRGIPSVKNYLFRNNDTLNFQTTIAEFSEYLKLYNGGKAPERLACIDKVGIHTIVDRDTHVWERQGSLLEFDRNELYQQSNTQQSGVTSQRMYPAASGYKSGNIAHQNLRNFERRLPEPSLLREVRSTENIKLYGSLEKSNGPIPIFSQYSQLERPTLRPELVRENITIFRRSEPLQSLPSPNNVPIIKIPPPQIKPPALSTVKSSQFLRGSQFLPNPAPVAAPSPAPTPIKFIQNTLVSPNKPIMESPRPVVNFQSAQGILRNHQSPTGMKHSHIIQKIHYPPQTHPHFIAQNPTTPKLNPMSQSHLLSSAHPIHQVGQPFNSIYTSHPVHYNRQVRTVPITVEVVPGKTSFIQKLASQTSNSQMISPQQLNEPHAEPKKKANAQSVASNKVSTKKIHTNVPAFISKHQKTASNLKEEQQAKPIEEIKIVENHVDNAIAMTHEKIVNKLQEPKPFSQLRQVISITQSQQSHKPQVPEPEHHEIQVKPVEVRPVSIKQAQQAKMIIEEEHQQLVVSDPIEVAADNESEHVSFTENSKEVDQHEATEQQESSLMNEAELRSERLISQQINKSQEEEYVPRPISNPNDNRTPLNSEYMEPQHLNSQLESVQNQRMQSNINSQVEQSEQTGQVYHLEEEHNRQFVSQNDHHSQIVEPNINDYQTYQIYQPKITYEVEQIERYESPDPSIAGHSMASITGGQKDDKYSLWTAGNRDYVSATLSIEPAKEISASFNPNFTNQLYGIPDVKTEKFELHAINNDNSYNPFGGNNVVYSSFQTAAIPTYESYESFETKSFTDDKTANVANINIDDGKSSEDFLRKLRQIGSGSSSSANPLPSASQTGYFNNYSSGYTNFKSGLDEDYGSSYLNNYSSSKYNYEDYKTPSYTSFSANAYEYQPNKYIDSEPYAFEPKFSNTYDPKPSFSDDDFGKNAVSNIIPTSYVSGENSLSYGQPLKFENNIALIYSRTEEVSPTQSPNGPSSYRARYDPQILADLQNLH